MVVVWGCGFCARALRRLVELPALLCCEAMVWSVTFLAFPIRMLFAVERERKLDRLIAKMQEQMDDLLWENRDLEERLQAAFKEQDAMAAVLDETEEENEDAFARIDALETQLKALKQENLRLNEHKGKAKWDKATPEESSDSGNKKRPWGEAAGSRAKGQGEEQDALKLVADPSCLAHQTTPPKARDTGWEDVLALQQAKAVARRQSLFSLSLSLAVGAVAWSADAPCLPLLAGLFAVVGVSMRSVSRSCVALRRGGPAVDAVALLSLNWFLLGVLTSPMLPSVARAVVPRASRELGAAVAWLAAPAPL